MGHKLKIILTEHAKQRMNDRNVSVEDIMQTLTHSTTMLERRVDGTQEYRRNDGKREFFVVIGHKRPTEKVVITVG
jgi:hypothetical protein